MMKTRKGAEKTQSDATNHPLSLNAFDRKSGSCNQTVICYTELYHYETD